MASMAAGPKFDPPYDRLFKGILSFKDLPQAELTIQKLENLRQRFCSVGDKKGVEYCRQLAVVGRLRARMVSRNPRVSLRKRREKKEMEMWFRIWLETPELFEDWLALRKRSAPFTRLNADLDVNRDRDQLFEDDA